MQSMEAVRHGRLGAVGPGEGAIFGAKRGALGEKPLAHAVRSCLLLINSMEPTSPNLQKDLRPGNTVFA